MEELEGTHPPPPTGYIALCPVDTGVPAFSSQLADVGLELQFTNCLSVMLPLTVVCLWLLSPHSLLL